MHLIHLLQSLPICLWVPRGRSRTGLRGTVPANLFENQNSRWNLHLQTTFVMLQYNCYIVLLGTTLALFSSHTFSHSCLASPTFSFHPCCCCVMILAVWVAVWVAVWSCFVQTAVFRFSTVHSHCPHLSLDLNMHVIVVWHCSKQVTSLKPCVQSVLGMQFL